MKRIERNRIKLAAQIAYQQELKNRFEGSRISILQKLAEGQASLTDAEQKIALLRNQLNILLPIRESLSDLIAKGKAQLEVIERSLVTLSQPLEVK